LQGYPFTFVRLAGCNLRCSYCDTKYAWEGGEEISLGEVLDSVRGLGLPRVLVTGGEPLLQSEALTLVEKLLELGYLVSLETNGSRPLDGVDPRCVKIVDVKTPGSGEAGSFLMENVSFLGRRDEVKFVMTDRADFDFALEFMERHLGGFEGQVLFSPAHGVLDPAELSRWMVEERVDARLNLQIHKLIFPEVERGV